VNGIANELNQLKGQINKFSNAQVILIFVVYFKPLFLRLSRQNLPDDWLVFKYKN